MQRPTNRTMLEISQALSRRHLLQGAAGAGLGMALPSRLRSAREATPTTSTFQVNCFTKGDNAGLQGLRVFQWAEPPADNQVDLEYPYWPCTDVASQQDITTSSWSGGKWHFVWSNRTIGGANQRANVVRAPVIRASNGLECRAIYTTVAKADAATRSFIRYTLGMANYTAPWIAAGGSATDFVGFDTLAADPDAYFTTLYTVGAESWQVIVDVPWTPQFRLVDTAPAAPGILLDYEVADNRGEAATSAFLQAVAADVHAAGKQLYVFTNPLNSGTAQNSGFTANNLPDLSKNHIDLLTLQLWSQNVEGDIRASYDNQIAMLGEFELEPNVSWEFEADGDTEGWERLGQDSQLTPLVVADGALSTTSTGDRPLMYQTEPMAVDASNGMVVEIVMEASTSSGGWVNWATVDEPLFTGERRADFTIVAGGMRTYRVHLPAESSNVSRLRIAPLRTEGDIRIDAIRVFEKVPVPGQGVDVTRLAITFELGNPGTTTTDAHAVHDILIDPVNPHPEVVHFWRNYAVQGGACDSLTNEKIAIVCFGAPKIAQ